MITSSVAISISETTIFGQKVYTPPGYFKFKTKAANTPRVFKFKTPYGVSNLNKTSGTPGVSGLLKIMEVSLRCHLCNMVLLNTHGRSNHMRNYWKSDNDPTRCDNVQRGNIAGVPLIPVVPVVDTAVPIDPAVLMARKLPIS